MMTLKRLLSFYRHSNLPRYATCILRPIVSQRVTMCLKRETRVLREQRLFKLCTIRGNAPQTRNLLRVRCPFKLRQTHYNAPQMRVSRLTGPRKDRISILKSVLLQQSENCVSTLMFASIQWMNIAFLLQTRSTSLRQCDLCVYKTCV